MRKFIATGLLLLLAQYATAEVLRLSDPVASDASSETFGAPIDDSLPQIALSDLVGSPEAYLGERVLIETRVGKVCQKKGCFFLATQGASAVRVAFKDYGFFIPTDTGGKTVTLVGKLIQRQVSDEDVAHFNSDVGGGETRLASGVTYEIVADAVRIPRS